MSGPKVVRIVTREEVVALCEQHLARLDAAIARWTKTGQQNDAIVEQDIAQVHERRDGLRHLLATDAFSDLQKAVPEEIAYLEADTRQRIDRAVARASSERTRRRRRVDAAKVLLSELTASARPVPADLSASLKAMVSGQSSDDAFAKAFAILAATTSVQTTEIADRLKEGERTISFPEWRSRQLDEDADSRLVSLDRLMTELLTIDARATDAFERRLAQISEEPSVTRRSLLIDSFVADLATATRVAREKEEVLAKLRERLAELKRFASVEAQELAASLERAVTASDVDEADRLLAAAVTQVSAEMSRVAAEARRQTILQGLSSLGYEVREGMATAFAKGEALVMRHANTPGFGLEVSGPLEAQRLQMRVVAFSAHGGSRDTSRDRDIELQWCGDFDRLRELLARVGGEMVIERSAAAGTQPLKVVEGSQHVSISETIEHPRLKLQRDP